jgi:hypothetical protein
MIVMTLPDRINLFDFNPPVVFQMRTAFRGFDSIVVIGRVDDEITSHHLFGLGIKAFVSENAVIVVCRLVDEKPMAKRTTIFTGLAFNIGQALAFARS